VSAALSLLLSNKAERRSGKSPDPYYFIRKTLIVLSAFLGFATPLCANVFSRDLEAVSDWLRLPTTDRCQQRLTTSLNWPHLADSEFPGGEWKQFINHRLRIVLDPGHGGKDKGAQGHFRISEKTLGVQVANLIAVELQKSAATSNIPIEIRLTRERDFFLSLRERVGFSNAWGADLFVSIHANWSPHAKPSGFEVYFLNSEASDAEARRLVHLENVEHEENLKSDVLDILSDVQTTHHIQESSLFAEKLFGKLRANFLPNGRGVRQGPFTVLAGTSMPAVLLELGFVSNIRDATQLRKPAYLKRLASSISSAILEFALDQKQFQAS
jgi:N-acetylmuramoyl-L-alanine amidase